MWKLKQNSLHRIYGFVLVLLVLFPFTVQAVHAIQNHEHEICTVKDEKHIHKANLDCSIYHTQVQQPTFDFSAKFSLDSPTISVYHFSHYQLPNYSTEKTLKSSRGPPCSIV